MTWFRQLFGLKEPQSYASIHSNFYIDVGSGRLVSKANGRSFLVGHFSTPTLRELREKGREALEVLQVRTRLTTSSVSSTTGGVKLHHVVHSDVLEEHARRPGALFQAASQFNCLEFPSPDGAPEDGVTDYAMDPTQGPACAIAAAAGTVFRNYFVSVQPGTHLGKGDTWGQGYYEDSRKELLGQTREHQLNNLDLLQETLNNGELGYFYVRNGYVESSRAENIEKLAYYLNYCRDHDESQYDELLQTVKIGLHKDLGVTFSSRWTPTASDGGDEMVVTQTYCSALSCGYSAFPPYLWEPLARLVLEANYEGTLWAAIINMAFDATVSNGYHPADVTEIPSSSNASNNTSSNNNTRSSNSKQDWRDHVFLTKLGGGVFRNEPEWISSAIARAVAVVSRESLSAPLHVCLCHHRQVDRRFVALLSRDLQQWGL